MTSDELESALELSLTPWQAQVLEKVLAQNPDGTWTHPNLRLAVPRADPGPCVMRSGRPHVCLRPDHDARHGRPTHRETA